MILKLFNFILGFLVSFIGLIIDTLTSLLPTGIVPDLSQVSFAINSFWTFCFGWVNWLRDALMLDSLTINLAIDILAIKFLYKPVISITKIFINWLKELL